MRRVSRIPKGDFTTSFHQLISRQQLSRLVDRFGPLKRRPALLALDDFLVGFVFHAAKNSGTLAANMHSVTGQSLSDSALSQRRQNLPWMLFDQLMEQSLQPIAELEKHPSAFYHGLVLLGLDGSQFSVMNTPENKGSFIKAASRRMKAAFGKVGLSVLVELGLHNPIAASVGPAEMSEQVLSLPLLDRLPAQSLTLADRAYGVGCWVRRILERYPEGNRHFLFRVKADCKSKVLELFPDGSAWVEIEVEGKKLQIREIRGRVKRPGCGWTEVRLWTSLQDWEKHPGRELMSLYGQRWEQEIFYKELKVDMRSTVWLKSHTVVTACQEIAALIIAHAVLVRERVSIAEKAGVEVLRISFMKTIEYLEPLWIVLQASEGILSKTQIKQMTGRVLDQIAQFAIPPRRKRSSPRAVRQPIGKWPRLTRNTYQHGETIFEISHFPNPIS